MYDVLIRLFYEYDYRKFTIEEIEEIKTILKQFKGEILEVKVNKVKEQENERTQRIYSKH